MSKESFQTEKMPDPVTYPDDTIPGESQLNDVGATANSKAGTDSGR